MSRASKRRAEREAKDAPKLGGADVVLAVAVGDGERGPNNERPYQLWIRGPYTDHTNAEMVQLLAMLATTIVIGNAQAGGISVQRSIDETKKVFASALDQHVHRAIAAGEADQDLRTVKLERERSSPGPSLGPNSTVEA